MLLSRTVAIPIIFPDIRQLILTTFVAVTRSDKVFDLDLSSQNIAGTSAASRLAIVGGLGAGL